MSSTSQSSAPIIRPKVSPSKKSKILLVDDDPAIRKILLRLLSEEGYSVLPAANGVEALEFASVAKFDLVLLDLNMPQKNGWETFERLAADDPLLPVIVITARPNQLFPALASGVGALLEKPLDFARLLETIRYLLNETPEVRLGRIAGKPSGFSYVPPKESESEVDGKISSRINI
ncbi:MAG: response regulator [Verrucomicrobiota bacterium]|jgi:CheY-like chemotaxis protein